jgi:Reverse transcriptase (RNA-dependent DNA polymerase)
VCLLSKALYGLKQSPRTWFQTLSTALVSYGFVASKYDPSLFIYNVAGRYMVILIYVDDIVLTGSHSHLLSHLVSTLQHSFALKDLGLLTYFLGIEVTSYPSVLHLS